MMLTIDMDDVPKRGDIVHTAIGTKRERTCLVLRVRQLKPTIRPVRVKVWAERWWQLEPEFRVRLYQSAERNGGQRVIGFVRYQAKKKQTFEQYMRRGGIF